MDFYYKKLSVSIKTTLLYVALSAIFIAIAGYFLYKLAGNKENNNQLLFCFIAYPISSTIAFYFVLKKCLKHQSYETNEFTKREILSHDIIQNANTAIVKFDLNGKIDFFNDYAQKLYGYAAYEIAGKNIFEVLVSHNNINKAKQKINTHAWMARILKHISTEPYGELWSFTQTGKRIYVGWTSKATYNKFGKMDGIISFGIDRTENKIIADLLNESQHKFKAIFNAVSDGILIISEKGELLEQNSAILTNLGLSQADIASSQPTKQVLLKLIPNLENLIKTVFEKGEILFEHEFRNIKGEKMIIEIRANKIIYEGKNAVLAVGRNMLNKKLNQQKIFNAALYAEEKERTRIAKELHDGVSPLLATVKLYVQTLKDADDELIKNTILLRTEATLNESIRCITEISNNLSPHILQNFGLIEAVRSFTEKISGPNNLHIEIKSNFESRLDKQIEIALYRVTNELLNNTVKYAKASHVLINFIKNSQYIMLKYTDNGVGFDTISVAHSSKGMGLFNITNRIKSINGNIDLKSSTDKGVIITIHIPIT